jgi:hypothetical protein
LIVLFDQMIPQYADAFAMTNFQRLRDSGVWFKQAMLGYMCSETVVSHNVVVSGKLPRNMGWTDAVLRDANNLLGFGVDSLHLTGDLSLANFSALIKYPKLADYVHAQFPGSSFIVVGEKSYAVRRYRCSDIGGPTPVSRARRRSAVDIAFPPARMCPRTSASRRAVAFSSTASRTSALRPRFRRGSTRATAVTSRPAPIRRTSAATPGSPTPRSPWSRGVACM